jgi:hypothetical protein
LFSPSRWLAALAILVSACGEKSSSELEAERRAQVRETLVRHLDHEEQMLALLERHRNEPERAASELALYAAEHGADLELLCAQRRLLETEPQAMASALSELAPRSQAVFSRRRALYDMNPTLMAHEAVKRALSRLDTL